MVDTHTCSGTATKSSKGPLRTHTSSNCAASGPSASPQSAKNGSNTRAQPVLQEAGRPELQSSPGSLQHSSFSAWVRVCRSGHGSISAQS
eukprot:COSAG04_NODE_827_length_10036_cov_6.659455_4_plen_90_part_00